ncbi:MAG: UMP kinase, partial [Candidatus Levybacteria bacterium]|nr:UMP kinase [Candidatus Levybacteria bacterium]
SDVYPVSNISWEEFRRIVGETWSPHLNAPFDPIATKKAQDLNLKVVILKGNDFENLKNYFDDKDFIGTTIG